MAPESASSHPWMLYVVLGSGILVVLAGAIPKILGPISSAMDEWAKRQRAIAVEADDADIADLRREKEYLRGVADERLREIKARDELIASHQVWDWKRYEELVQQGKRPDMPPPLRPDVPETPADDGVTLD